MRPLSALSALLASFLLSAGLMACGGGGGDGSSSVGTTATPASSSATPSGSTGTTGTGISGTPGTETTGTGSATPGSTGTGTTPPSGGTGGTVTLTARVTAAPADGSDGTIICSFPRIEVTGTGMQNVELVPPDSLAPVIARFVVSTDGTFATLDFSTLPKSTTLRVRILAWDVPPGQFGHFVVAMEPRTWHIGDPAQPPCLSPGSSTPR